MHRDETEKLVLDTAMDWWTSELEKARTFLKTLEWESQIFGARRPKVTGSHGQIGADRRKVAYLA